MPAPDSPHSDGRRVSLGLLFVALCLIGVNMRSPITGIGPLLEQISASTGEPLSTLSLLTAVPVLSWAIVSSIAHPLTRAFGMRRVVFAALVLLGVGSLARSLPEANTQIGLWTGTVLVGATLAILNVLMPAVVKQSFGARSTLVTSVYTSLFAGFGAIASSLVVPVSYLTSGGEGSAGWRVALVAMSATLPFAILLWGWHVRQVSRQRRALSGSASETNTAPTPARTGSVWRDRTAWLVGLYMGVQSIMFYAMLTWIAPYSRDLGRSEIVAGNDVMIFQIVGMAGSLLLPLAMRGHLMRWMPSILPLIGIVGTAGLLLAPQFIVVWLGVQGLSSGSSIAIALTLMAIRARDHHTASALSGMAQSVGYAISGAAPLIFGWLHTVTGGWAWPFGYVLAGLTAQALLGIAAGRERYVFD